jgi:hypothetical protein
MCQVKWRLFSGRTKMRHAIEYSVFNHNVVIILEEDWMELNLPCGVCDTETVLSTIRWATYRVLRPRGMVYGCIYPTTFHISVYVIHCIIGISEGLKSPLRLWACDNTKSKVQLRSNSLVSYPMTTLILVHWETLGVVSTWMGDLTN